MQAVKRAGGVLIAQDEASADAFGMPRAAIASGGAGFVLLLERIAPTVLTLIGDRPTPIGVAGG